MSATRQMSDKELRRLCRRWQKRLGLQHWEVVVGFKRYWQMDDAAGSIHCVLKNQTACISISLAVDHALDCMTPYDPEQYLVHELLHLHFESFIEKDNPLKYTLQEQAIQAIAKALVNTHREGKHGKQ